MLSSGNLCPAALSHFLALPLACCAQQLDRERESEPQKDDLVRILLRSTDRSALFISSALVEHHATHTIPSGICIGCSWECTRSHSPLKNTTRGKVAVASSSSAYTAKVRLGLITYKNNILSSTTVFMLWPALHGPGTSTELDYVVQVPRDLQKMHHNEIPFKMWECKSWIVSSVANKHFYGLLLPLEMHSSYIESGKKM